MRPGVLITGGARRIGAGMARYFAARGYDIGLHYNNSVSEARQLQAELTNAGVACHIFKHDMADIGGMPNFMAAVLDVLPNCNALINNAGPSGNLLIDRTPLIESLDGNTVDVQAEQAAFAETSIRYQASLNFVNSQLRGLMTAITGQ